MCTSCALTSRSALCQPAFLRDHRGPWRHSFNVTLRQSRDAPLRLVRHAVYNREPMPRDGAPFDTTEDQNTLGSGLDMPGGLVRGDAALKASLKAAMFQAVQEPTRIGRFTLIERVGVGAMGEVYAAYDSQLDRKVALKLVRPDRLAEAGGNAADAMISQRLLREAKVLARLSHPNVVQVYDADIFGDRVFVAMEFIDGQSLRQWLATQSDLPEPRRWRKVLDVLMAAGRGLEAAHRAGLVHRDFKPDNVLVGADQRVCVADFGLARPSPDRTIPDASSDVITRDDHARSVRPGDQPRRLHDLTESRAILGTPGYMSPEQMLGDPSDSRSDQFSFCVVLYEALYRVRPFVAKDLDDLKRRVVTGAHAEPPRDTEVPAWIWKVIARGLAVEPEARHASMGALLAALGRDPAQRRRRYLMVALFLAAGGLVGGGIVFQAGLTSSADPCALAGSAVTRLWSPAVADRVHAAFLATNVAYAGAAWDLVRERVDGYAGALGAERKATCEATHVRHEQPEELFRLKTLCLDRGERHLDALVAALGQADASTVEHSARMAAGLPRIEACRDGESLVLGVQPPGDAALAAVVQDVRDRLARVHVQHAAGHHQQAQRLAEEALVAAPPAYPPVRAEALHALGVVLGDGATAADIARAEELLLEAVNLAESQRSDALVNEIWLDLVRLAKRHHQELVLAHQWVRRALATSHRVPDGGQQRSLALGHLGSLHYREGEYVLAEREQREALALAEQSGAPELALSDRWQALANTLEAMSRATDARGAYEKALETPARRAGRPAPARCQALPRLRHVPAERGRERSRPRASRSGDRDLERGPRADEHRRSGCSPGIGRPRARGWQPRSSGGARSPGPRQPGRGGARQPGAGQVGAALGPGGVPPPAIRGCSRSLRARAGDPAPERGAPADDRPHPEQHRRGAGRARSLRRSAGRGCRGRATAGRRGGCAGGVHGHAAQESRYGAAGQGTGAGGHPGIRTGAGSAGVSAEICAGEGRRAVGARARPAGHASWARRPGPRPGSGRAEDLPGPRPGRRGSEPGDCQMARERICTVTAG